MLVQIRHRFTNEVIHECEAESLKAAVEECAKLGKSLAYANLSGSNLYGAKNADYAIAQTRILPEGTIYGYKKVRTPTGTGIVKLLIPEYAARSHAFGRKCRCEYAEVIEAPEGAYTDDYGPRTEYRVGEVVKPDKWDENWQEECSNGIHFFITRLEAENYE